DVPSFVTRASDRTVERFEIIAVLDARCAPAVGVEALQDVLGPGHLGGAVELAPVVVVEDKELAQAQVPGERCRLGCDAFLEVPVGGDGESTMVDDRVS